MILHIDMDAFYAAVELRDQPELKGLPVVVGGSPKGRGVIAASSYEARKYGIFSAMSSAQALRLCRDLVFIKPRMEHYAKISKQIRGIFHQYTSVIEPIAFDEAFLDVSGCEKLFGDSVSIAKQIKQQINSETGLVASAGVAPNKFLAKVASDLEKPDGLTVVTPDGIQAFLDPLPIKRIWGVGKVTEEKFARMGIRTVADMRQLDIESMRAKFGINSEHFFRLARGLDTRPVVSDRHAKSISHETTFGRAIYSIENLVAWILELSDQVARRMRRYDIVGKTVNLKIRFGNFETITRAQTISGPSHCTRVLSEAAIELLQRTLAPSGNDRIDRGIRLLGMGVSNLSLPKQQTQGQLFDGEERQKQNRIDRASDAIRDRFGSGSLRRATSVQHKIKNRRDPRLDDEV